MSKKLQDELRQAGASVDEARSLARVAQRFSALKESHAPERVRQRSFWLQLAPLTAVAVVFLVVGMAAVASAQTSIPGSILYPLKRVSEDTAVSIVPSYRATLMMRRADEVGLLINNHASSARVLATLAAYKTQASDYKIKDYAAFSYCKDSLEQAQKGANPTEKQQIASTLVSLKDID